MEYLVEKLAVKYEINEDVWKRIDRLEAYVNDHVPYHIGNKICLQIESYLSVYLTSGGAIGEAVDGMLSSKLLPTILSLTKGNAQMAEVDLIQTVASIFGDEYIESTLTVNEGRKGVRERLAVSTVRDSKTGKIYIKMVNLLNHPVKGKLDLTKMTECFATTDVVNARLHLLTGKYDDLNARPQESEIKVTPNFEYELPAYSFSLIEL